VVPALVLASVVSLSGEQVVRTPYAAAQGRANTAKIVSVGPLVFPSGVEGTRPDAADQVQEIVERLHQDLLEIGLGIGHMIQHTIYLKDGAIQPMAVLQRFHATATKLAPSLRDKPSAGTILRVPEFADPRTLVAVDVVAASPGKGRPDTFPRVPFTFGPKEIVETVSVGNHVFTAGNEAMDFQIGKFPPAIDEQVDAIVGKVHASLQKLGLSIGNMVSHNLYVTRGTDPIRVINRFHEAARKRAPGLVQNPSVGTLAIVNGMAVPGFLLEVDAVAAVPQVKGKPDRYARVLFTETKMDIAKSVVVDDLVHLAGMEGVDFANKGTVSPNVLDQVEVAVKKIDDTLRASRLSIGSMVKHKLYVKKGQNAQQARDAFHRAALRLAPQLAESPSAETLIVVEGLAGERLLFEASVIASRTK
jgi:enamine deaminase RidA (YjgF/YER057c/UK114 family)